LVVTFFAQAQRTYQKFKDRFYKQVTLGVAMMFAASFVNNFFSELIETHKVGALFYMSISLLIILTHKSKKEQEQTSHPLP
jgi:O-antigen ligase